jgi:hypothetical protein
MLAAWLLAHHAHLVTEVEDHSLSNAMPLLLKAAETSSSADRKVATEQVASALTWHAMS